jgi:hypothetical protein
MIHCLRPIRRLLAFGLVGLLLPGCASPEDGRARGSGPGGDGGNYRVKPIHAPSKIDGTKDLRSVLSIER